MALRPASCITILCATALAGCQRQSPFPPYSGPETCTRYRAWSTGAFLRSSTDVLFVVENSPRMAAMVPPVEQRIREFLRLAQDSADRGTYPDLHVALVTTDMGAGVTGSADCEPANARPRGVLQPIGVAARPGCHGPVDANWIRLDFHPAALQPHNLPSGQSFTQTLECMAAVGHDGCDYPQPLEAAYAALRNPANRGFLREEAELVVVFITAQEDCSAPDDTDLFNPHNPALGPPGPFRCTRSGVECGEPLPIDGLFTGSTTDCRALAEPIGPPNARLHELRRYSDFFQRPRIEGGVKDNPFDVVLLSVRGPDTPFQPVRSELGSSPLHPVACSPPAQCTGQLLPSCTSGEFFGTPSVRVGALVHSVKVSGDGAVCDPNWSVVGGEAFRLFEVDYGISCFADALRDPDDPDCRAEDVTSHADGTISTVPLPRCIDDAHLPCWNVIRKKQCVPPVSPQGIGLDVRREYFGWPPHTSVRIECAVPCPK